MKELVKRGFSRTQVDKHIRQVRQRFGFDVRTARSRRGRHTPPDKLPEIIFIEEKRRTAPTTSSATVTTPSSVTPATPSTSKPVPLMGGSTETVEQTIGSITVAGPGEPPGERGRLPIISTVFSLSTTEGAEGTEEQGMEVEYVSTVMKDFEPLTQKSNSLVQTYKLRKRWWKKICIQVTQDTTLAFNMSIRIGRKQKRL